MDLAKTHLDWSLVPSLLAVVDHGSLSAAARALGLSQPTLGRQIHAAEAALGGSLFDRHARGLAPTALMRGLDPIARQMEAAAKAMALTAAGQSVGQGGPVRLTASHVVSVFLLPPILAAFRADHPAITIDLIPSDASQNLLFHEADLALRMYRPTQLDMVTRHLGDLALGLFAADSYLARRGAPDRIEDLPDHDLVGYDRDDRLIRGFREAGLPLTRDSFALRCDDQVAYWQLVGAGAGIGVGPVAVASRTPGLRRIVPQGDLPRLPVWLTAHERLRHVPRVDALWRALADGLKPALT